MPKKSNQKLRLLYMKDILEKHTDENHGTTISQIMRKLIREHLARDASQGVLSKSKEVRKEENVYE